MGFDPQTYMTTTNANKYILRINYMHKILPVTAVGIF